MTASKGMTPAQIRLFWRALHSACQNLGHRTTADREAYRKTVMGEETGKHHLRDLDRTHDFDRCMARFAEDAGDYALVSKFVVGDAHRMAFLVSVMCGQVLQLKGCPGGTTAERDYLAGIIGQARVQCGGDPRDPSYWLDVAPDSLRSLFAMLDTHRRRLLRRLGGGGFAAFDPGVSYTLKPGGGVIIVKSPPCAGGAAWPQ